MLTELGQAELLQGYNLHAQVTTIIYGHITMAHLAYWAMLIQAVTA